MLRLVVDYLPLFFVEYKESIIIFESIMLALRNFHYYMPASMLFRKALCFLILDLLTEISSMQ